MAPPIGVQTSEPQLSSAVSVPLSRRDPRIDAAARGPARVSVAKTNHAPPRRRPVMRLARERRKILAYGGWEDMMRAGISSPVPVKGLTQSNRGKG